MKTILLAAIGMLLCLPPADAMHGRMPAQTNPTDTMVVTFKFLPKQDMFYIPWAGNSVQLAKLYKLLDEYRSEITAGRMPVYVDGYCSSHPAAKENLNTAYLRANRVKSELILQKGLKESHFVTGNYPRAYYDNKDVVVVTLRIPMVRENSAKKESTKKEPAKKNPMQEGPSRKQPTPTVEAPQQEAAVEKQPESQSVAESMPTAAVQESVPYRFAARTNLLYDAFLLPTLGIEWRINSNVGVRLDGSLSRWGDSTGKVQKMWLLSPEVRWYLLENKRLYAGVSGNYGEYNIYKYVLGGLMKDDIGYQGKLWSAGLTVGYQLPLSSVLALDFNLGLGYARSEYDSFGLIDGVRVYKQRDKTKNFWGPTQAGISLLWTIGGNK